MNKVMYADCDTPQSFEAPLPPVLQKAQEDRISSSFQSQPQSQRKARPIEHTRIWVLYDNTNTPDKSGNAAEQVA